mgnify:CR=1 FL=1
MYVDKDFYVRNTMFTRILYSGTNVQSNEEVGIKLVRSHIIGYLDKSICTFKEKKHLRNPKSMSCYIICGNDRIIRVLPDLFISLCFWSSALWSFKHLQCQGLTLWTCW